jgi:hypothetical protein
LVSYLTVIQALELIMPELLYYDMETVCLPLIKFITADVVKPTENRSIPLTMQKYVGKSRYVSITATTSYRRDHVLHQDLTGHHPSVTSTTSNPALLDVARGVLGMVVEVRAYINDRADYRALTHLTTSIHEGLGEAIVDRVLCAARKMMRTSRPCTMIGKHDHDEYQNDGCSSRR